ncbi:MAG: 1-acyl-sn-glycerol-3-phosphate acyltransferase [Actinomycetota bacterium]|nr:1-acyl-sn-glycerol-3-phosphate acyltransferase [Actinomycetota bacterium]
MPDVYPAVIAVMATAFRALGLRITVTGGEQVPTHGPAVLASNHSGYPDFALLGFAARRSRRHVRFLARYDVWDSWFAGPFMRSMRHIPVDRQAPAAAFLTARSALRRGEVVGVFPEAGVSTSFTIRPVMPGAVALALATGAPLFPVVIWGSQRIYTVGHRLDLTRGRPIRVLVGRPFPVRGDLSVVDQTRGLGERMAELLDQVQRSHRDQPNPDGSSWWHPAHLGGAAPTPEQARRTEPAMPTGAVSIRSPAPGPFAT